MKRISLKKWILMCLLMTFFVGEAVISQAATDKKAPKITYSFSTKEVTNGTVKITIKVTDSSQISSVKWASGSQKAAYFKEKGKKLTLKKSTASVTVKKNGTYTFYAKDSAGNTAVKKVTVKNIDTVLPLIEAVPSKTEYTNKSVKLKVTVSDADSGIKEVKYLSGKKTLEEVAVSGKPLTLKEGTGSITVKKNGSYSIAVWDQAGNNVLITSTIKNIDTTEPVLTASYNVMEQKATVSVNSEDEVSSIQSIKYYKGNLAVDSEEWNTDSAITVEDNQFVISESGDYTILAEDVAGNKTVFPLEVQLEFRAVWISYLEFSKNGYTEEEFKAHIDEMYDNCVEDNMNAVVVQVRPLGDAFYPSKYFPWSVYVSGEQGKNPGYDPLKYMVDAAHERDLAFHAWINPYRITLTGTKVSALSEDNPARKWREDESTERNVLTYDGKLYYNPASKQAQMLIVNGVKEIVTNYDVDGIHFDDYFYPNLGTSYKSNFDATEYKEYKAACEKKGTTVKNIVDWRRENVNTLVEQIYAAIKEINENCVFGISPAGNMSNLYAANNYYSDVKLWMKSSNYIDYICPQIYWSFQHKTAAYDKMLKEWLDAKISDTVNLYVGLAAYRAGISKSEASSIGDPEWGTSKTVLKRQVLEGRNSGIVDGFILFRYDYIVGKKAATEMKNLVSILN
ncbi:MAG: glycoside hydrolase family 10 protein [Acetivibrio ethanolgignens]